MSRPLRADAKSLPFHVRLSPDEHDRLTEAATANHQTPSQFARDALVTAAEDSLEVLEPPKITTKKIKT